MRITKKQDRMPGIILTILLFVAEIAFTVLLLYTNLLSAKYIGIVFAESRFLQYYLFYF